MVGVSSLLAFIVAAVVAVADVPSPRPEGWVADQANALDASSKRRLNLVAGHLYRRSGVELAVVTVDDVAGSPKQFATALFARWKIGNAATNTGVLVLLVTKRRRIEIETGRGIAAALDAAWLADMERRTMVPRFKAGDLAGGLIAGSEAISARLEAAPAESWSTAFPGEYRSSGRVVRPASHVPVPLHDTPATTHRLSPEPAGSDGWLVIVICMSLVVVFFTAYYFVERRGRFCRVCKPSAELVALTAADADAHLSDRQRVEQRIGSVEYTVKRCPGCGAMRTDDEPGNVRHFAVCRGCEGRCATVERTVLSEATYEQAGYARVTTHCAACAAVHIWDESIPMLYHASYTSDDTSTSWDSDSSSSASDSSSTSSSDASSDSGGGDSDGSGAGDDY